MARIRTIKPEYWDSPAMAGMDPWARLLFIAMWNWADDYGRGTADPKMLSGFAFPKDEHITSADIRRMLGEIRRGFEVVFYEVAGRPYYAIPSWEKHQKIDNRSKPKYPAPEEGIAWNPDPQDSTWTTRDQQAPTDDSRFGGSSADPAENPPSSRRTLGAGTGELGTGEITTRPAAEPQDTLFNNNPPPAQAPKQRQPPRLTEAAAEKTAEWKEFWYKAFPRRDGRAPALKAWVKAVGDLKVDPGLIIAGAYAYARNERAKQTDPSKIKMAQGWLNDRRWEDHLGTPESGAEPKQLSPRCEKHSNFPAATCSPCRADNLAAKGRVA